MHVQIRVTLTDQIAIISAHEKLGLVHRDISPANIILYPDYDSPAWQAYQKAVETGGKEKMQKALCFIVCKAILVDWELAVIYDKNRVAREYVMTASTPSWCVLPFSNVAA